MKSENTMINDSEYHLSCEALQSQAGKEKAAGPEKTKNKKPYPGILEEGLVYSCAGPRIDQ